MAEKTKIQWCDATFNPFIGCSKVNEGCANCYAENMMDTRYHKVQWGPRGTRKVTKTWNDPVRWNKQAAASGEKHKVFCASLADVFEDWTGPMLDSNGNQLFTPTDQQLPNGDIYARPTTMDDVRDDLFKLIDQCENLYWLLLTKRPESIRSMWPDDGLERENCWLGTSIANQRNADVYIDRLLEARNLAPVLFLSVEPQISFVDLSPCLQPEPLIGWVIVGGESKQGGGEARPFHIEWATDMVDQCRHANVPCFVKQLGSNVYQGHRPIRLRDSHGGDMAEWPAEIRIRECPEVFYASAA